MGDVLGIADADLWVSAVVAAAVLSVVFLFFRHLQLTSFDPIMAASIGLPVVLIDYVLTACVSLVVVSAVSMVGVILVVGLLITPASTAYLLSDRLSRMMALAALFGVTSVAGGLYLCMWLDSAGGGAIMLFCTLQFLAVLFVAPRYGILADWLRRRRLVPQQLVEDVLRAVLRAAGERSTMPALLAQVPGRGAGMARAIRSLGSSGLLALQGEEVSLTEAGRCEALRVQRAHRLWETYLQHVGTPGPEIHPRAHELEHVGDQDSVEYIAHVLGHPEHDPHGARIPATHGRGDNRQLSLLRARERGVVVSIAPAAATLALKVNDRIEMGERRDGGATWLVTLADGRELHLDHAAADGIVVRIDG
jgi:manganese/iron transport system permease protein/iron/zinc/copper transport system permease protein